MNTPFTWGDFYYYKFVGTLVGLAFLVVLTLLEPLLKSIPAGYCRICARPLQWRWRKPWQYASRRFCPYHDEGSQ